MKNADFVEACWLAVYGSMIALQCREYTREGKGAVTEEAMERFIEEAEAVADLEFDLSEVVNDTRVKKINDMVRE